MLLGKCRNSLLLKDLYIKVPCDQWSRFGECFRDEQCSFGYLLVCCSSTHGAGCPLCPGICKSGGTCPPCPVESAPLCVTKSLQLFQTFPFCPFCVSVKTPTMNKMTSRAYIVQIRVSRSKGKEKTRKSGSQQTFH